MTDMDTIVSLCKRRGFVFPGSEVYGGLGGFWDYGPLGVELKNNIKRAWWKSVVQERDDVVGLDAAVIMNPAVWRASGHVTEFTDPMVDCKSCRKRFKADDLADGPLPGVRRRIHRCAQVQPALPHLRRPGGGRGQHRLPAAGDGPGHLCQLRQRPDHDAQEAALRHRPDRQGLPQRDHPGQLHLPRPRVRAAWRSSSSSSRAPTRNGTRAGHRSASTGTSGWASIPRTCACAHPTPWPTMPRPPSRSSTSSPWAGASWRASPTAPTMTLRRHSEDSLKDLSYFDEETNERLTPYVIEPSAGVDRSLLTFLLDAYREEQVRNEKRVVLKLHKDLAPIKVAVLPLARNRPGDRRPGPGPGGQVPQAHAGHVRRHRQHRPAVPPPGRDRHALSASPWTTRRRSPDDPKYDGMVTVRDRDTMEQVRVPACRGGAGAGPAPGRLAGRRRSGQQMSNAYWAGALPGLVMATGLSLAALRLLGQDHIRHILWLVPALHFAGAFVVGPALSLAYGLIVVPAAGDAAPLLWAAGAARGRCAWAARLPGGAAESSRSIGRQPGSPFRLWPPFSSRRSTI